MRKLTFAALLLLLVCFMVQGGPEQILRQDKEVIQPAPPPCEFFRAHEWNLSFWGTYVFSANPGRNHVPNDDPFTPNLDPEILVDTTIGTTGGGIPVPMKPEELNPDERVNLGQESEDSFLGRDDSWGGGVDLKYFWSKYFGVGIEGFVVDTETQLGGSGLVTLTARYPMGRFAPYAWAGAGALAGGGRIDRFYNEVHTYEDGFVTDEEVFFTNEEIENNDVFFNGQLGVGIEYRLTCHMGLMADFAWNFIAGGESDRIETITLPGGTNFSESDPPVTFDERTAPNVIPGSNADDKHFGMVRFGLTIAY